MTSLPYLRQPIFLDGREVRFQRKKVLLDDELEAWIVERVFEGGADLDDLAREVHARGRSPGFDEARELLRQTFSDPDNLIGLIDVALEPAYDVILVEQGYGGVYVHSVELAKKLQQKHTCLLVAPVDPLFGDKDIRSVVSLPGLRVLEPELGYFSYTHIVRSIVRRTRCKLLLIAHRSQSLFLFDLIGAQPTIIFCDGFYDGMFHLAVELKFPGGPRARQRVLSEVYYLLSNGDPGFFGMLGTPSQNHYVLMAGYVSLRDARENWCWGDRQTQDFRAAFPKLRRPIRFMPPFMDPDVFDPAKEQREKVVLFTTTMHNIEKKGFPELVKAMKRMPDMRVRCVVRQPEHLPKYPKSLDRQFEMGAVSKAEMIALYHKVWVNCRTSREESSPVSILESMVCAVPQIVSPMVAEQIPLIEDGQTGFVVHPDDEKGLVKALRAILADEALRNRMGREARRRACEYSFERRYRHFARYLGEPE